MKGKGFRSISVRLTAFALVISIFPLLFVSTVFLTRMESMSERELDESYRWIVSEHIGNIRNKLELYESCLDYIARNNTIQETLISTEINVFELGNTISSEIFKVVPMEKMKEVNNCLIYATGPANVYGTRVKMMTELDRKQWEEKGWQGGDICFIDQRWTGQSLLSMIRQIQYVDVDAFTVSTVGYVRLDLILEGLLRRPMTDGRNGQLIVTDENGRCLYESAEGLEEMLIEFRDQDGVQQRRVDSGGKYVGIEEKLSEYGLRFLYLFNNNERIVQKESIRWGILSVTLVILLLVILVAKIYFSRFSRRVSRLTEKFRIAGTGNLSSLPPIGGQDEIAILDRSFSQMLQDMENLNRRNEAQQNAIREARYHNLQLQINPHFLYNTLETISSIGAINGVMQICDLCEKLGEIFRYSLGKNEGKYTTVAKEIRQIQNYIFIQQVRHPFQASYELNLDANSFFMLRFLLQPIVENAILHGLNQENSTGRLEVSVSVVERHLEIAVCDNGRGMTEERLEEIRRGLTENADGPESGDSIGLRNISQRIHLTHGEKFGVILESEAGKGCRCILCLPIITKEMRFNE